MWMCLLPNGNQVVVEKSELSGQRCLNSEHGLAWGRTNAWRPGGAAPLAASYINSKVRYEQPQAASGWTQGERHWRIEGG